MWGFMKRMLGGDEKPSQTTEEGERSDIRRPGGLPGGNGESRVADTPAASPAATPVMGDDDHLGKAAVARQAARQAIKDKRYDDAWRYLHEQQAEWLKHSAKQGMTAEQTLSLLSSIHEGMANVLRLEGKHDQALANILYCVATNSRPTQAQERKLISYFRRCKFGDQYGEDRVEAAVKMLRHEPDYRIAQQIVSQWRNGTGLSPSPH